MGTAIVRADRSIIRTECAHRAQALVTRRGCVLGQAGGGWRVRNIVALCPQVFAEVRSYYVVAAAITTTLRRLGGRFF